MHSLAAKVFWLVHMLMLGRVQHLMLSSLVMAAAVVAYLKAQSNCSGFVIAEELLQIGLLIVLLILLVNFVVFDCDHSNAVRELTCLLVEV